MLAIDVDLALGSFRRRVVLRENARIVALTGHSGAGKTSLLNAIAGLVTPTRGRIEVDGRVLFDSANGIDVPVHRRRVGYIFQDARLFPHLTVQGNLLYGRREGSSRFVLDDVVALLGIEAVLARRPSTLSGGEAQRVAIGRALLSQPDILLLDEPLSALDRARRDELIGFIQRVRDEAKLPMVYVSHSLDEVRRLTDVVHDFD